MKTTYKISLAYVLIFIGLTCSIFADDNEIKTIAQTSDTKKETVSQKSEAVDIKAILSQTDERILKMRTAPMVIEVVDNNGNPVKNAKVDVQHIKHLFYFGAGFNRMLLKTNMNEIEQNHRDAFLRLFNYATVHLYWGSYEFQQGRYNHKVALDSIKWLKEHGLTPRGHPIHWNHRASVPRWVAEMKPDSDKMRSLLSERVKQLSETVLPGLHDADVFNELVNWERFDNPFTSLIKERGKIATVVDCIKEVKNLNPNLLLAINDYETSPKYYSLLKELMDAGAPFDLIGQQSHMHSGNWSFQQMWEILERLSKLNKPILFTELSVLSGPKRKIDWSTERPLQDWNSEPEFEKDQADYLEKFYSIAYSHSNCIGVVMWNYTDGGAWLGAPVGVLRKDGSKKPSFERLDKLINEKWRTKGSFTTDDNGKITISNGFEGEYLIKSGTNEVKTTHSPRSPAVIKITLN
ncbi:MAG TPA: endo-1,4-beta-xylanase [Verrucomicrobiota bacterium]|nr:endo-1,4-beta-xylanase [Verrucomicrobiota bacterium]